MTATKTVNNNPIPCLPWGVEIECFLPNRFWTGGDSRGFNSNEVPTFLREWARTNRWNMVHDASLYTMRYYRGKEFVSPILEGKSGAEQVEYLCRQIKTHTNDFINDGPAKKAKVNAKCGLHIHVDTNWAKMSDGTSMTSKFKKRVLRSAWIAIQDKIKQTVPQNRRDGRYCEDIRRLDGGGKFYAICTDTIHDRGDVEIRLHAGTINAKDILNWAAFCTTFVKSVLENAESAIKIDGVAAREKIRDAKLLKLFYGLMSDDSVEIDTTNASPTQVRQVKNPMQAHWNVVKALTNEGFRPQARIDARGFLQVRMPEGSENTLKTETECNARLKAAVDFIRSDDERWTKVCEVYAYMYSNNNESAQALATLKQLQAAGVSNVEVNRVRRKSHIVVSGNSVSRYYASESTLESLGRDVFNYLARRANRFGFEWQVQTAATARAAASVASAVVA